MDRFDDTQDLFGIYKYDSYIGKPIWSSKENSSTYYDYNVDMQCCVPIHSVQEILKEMSLEDN